MSLKLGKEVKSNSESYERDPRSSSIATTAKGVDCGLRC
jgi:hypothetical protein